jgi:hypothetical protein
LGLSKTEGKEQVQEKKNGKRCAHQEGSGARMTAEANPDKFNAGTAGKKRCFGAWKLPQFAWICAGETAVFNFDHNRRVWICVPNRATKDKTLS